MAQLDGITPWRRRLKRWYLAVPFKRQIFSLLRRVWLPPPHVYRRLYFNGAFSVPVGDTSFKVANHALEVETEIFWTGLTGGWEKQSLSIWIELCRRADVILDVGANTGIYSLVAKSVNPGARVHSFEPVHRVFEKLGANVALNGYDIACHEVALSDYDGEGVFYDLPVDHIYTVTLNQNLHPAEWPAQKTAVPTRRLSTFIEERRLERIDLMKIDVESHEPQVLAGMGEYLRRMRPTLLVEIWNDRVGEEVERLVSGLDYVFFRSDEVQPFTADDHIRNHHPENGYLSYLICRKAVADRLFGAVMPRYGAA